MTLLGAVSTPVYRGVARTFTNGRLPADTIAGRGAAVNIDLTIEPLSARQSGGDRERVERLTGRSLLGGLRVFSESELKTDNPATQTGPDWIYWRGAYYDVIAVGYWGDDTLGHYECFAARMEPQPS